MPKNSKQPLIASGAKELHGHTAYELEMTWRLRWFFARILALGYVASTCTGILGFIFTHNPSYLALAPAPFVLLPAMRYLVPMDERRYHIELCKIEVKAEEKHKRLETRQNLKTSSASQPPNGNGNGEKRRAERRF
jgi:hypothetical protein